MFWLAGDFGTSGRFALKRSNLKLTKVTPGVGTTSVCLY